MPDHNEDRQNYTSFERVILDEVRRLSLSLNAFEQKMEAKLDDLTKEAKSDSEKLEIRVRDLEQRKPILDGVIAWRDGTNTENGAASKIDELRRWQSWILGGMAVVGIIGAAAAIAGGAWFTNYIDKRNEEHTALVEKMVSTQLQSVPAPATPPHR